MIRRLRNVASVIWLLLWTACVVLWVFTYYRSVGMRADYVTHSAEGMQTTRLGAEILRGGFGININHQHALTGGPVSDLSADDSPPFEIWSDSVKELDDANGTVLPLRTYRFKPTSPSPLGFQFAEHAGTYEGSPFWNVSVAIPFWLPFVLLSAPPAFWVSAKFRLWRRRRSGACPSCGYDLRASTGRCPECGTRINSKQEAKA